MSAFENLPSGSFCLKGSIDVPDERLDAVLSALDVHIDLTRKEPGCIFFNVDPCNEVQGRFLVSEAFVDEAGFAAHQRRAGASVWAKVTEGIARSYETWIVD